MATRGQLSPADQRFSKQLDNHVKALVLYFVHYNFIRIQRSLRITRAMAVGIADTVWDRSDVLRRMDKVFSPSGPRGPYRNNTASAKLAV